MTMHYRLVVFFTILIACFVYTGFKAVPFFARKKGWAWGGAFILFLLMIGWQFVYRSHASLGILLTTWAWLGSFLLGAWATFVIFSLPFDAIYLLTILVRALRFPLLASGWISPIFHRFLPGFLAVVSFGMSLVGLHGALINPRVKDVIIHFERLPRALEQLKIVQISDLHVSPILKKGFVNRIVEQVLSLKPDVIFFTGDMADGTVESLSADVEPLSRLKAPLGVFYITGNHEYYWDAPAWIEKAKALGFETLMNENRVVKFHDVPILIGGVTDIHAVHFIPEQKSDPWKARQSLEPALFKILLAHRPQSYLEAEKAGFDLQISGHAHGGQFFPFNLLMPLTRTFYRGLNRHGNLWVYVNVGTGYWGPPNRWGVPSEITVFHLRGSPS